MKLVMEKVYQMSLDDIKLMKDKNKAAMERLKGHPYMMPPVRREK